MIGVGPFAIFAFPADVARRQTSLRDLENSVRDKDKASTPRRFRVVAIERPARHLTLARLAVPQDAPFSFRAGQYARVGFDGKSPRNLSIASRPTQSVLEFHIRDVPGLFEKLKPGEQAGVEGPFGSGFLREDHEGPILAAAGGSGIAPIKSIIETALQSGMRQEIHLYFGVRDEPDLYLEANFDSLAREFPNFHFVPVLSAGANAAPRRKGLVAEAVTADFPSLASFKAYVFGPPGMVRTTVHAFLARGISADDIHSDEPLP